MQNSLKARLDRLADSFRGTSNTFGPFSVTHIGNGLLKVNQLQLVPEIMQEWLTARGVK